MKNKIEPDYYFTKNGYLKVENAISNELRDFITQYALFDEMQDFNSSVGEQVPNAHHKYADPAMETLLLNLKDIMEKNTGLTLYPTYSYYRVYRNGDVLENHMDRESCEISTSLCFNYSFKDTEYSSPLYMDGIPVFLKPGDMVIYKGCELPHWREKLVCDDEDWLVQGFFHYVNANGNYKDFKFDKRTNIGILPKWHNKSQLKSKKSYIEFI